MSIETFVNIAMQSPVLVAIVGSVAAVATAFGKKPITENEEAKTQKANDKQAKIDRLLEINEHLNKHINNSSEPLRHELNKKLDTITDSIDLLSEATKGVNLNLSNLDRRITHIEEDVDTLSKDANAMQADIDNIKKRNGK